MEETHTTEVVSEAEIAEAIRSATKEVFSMMLGIEITAGEMHKGDRAGTPRSGVVALLGLAGDWVGSGSLCCEPPFACRLASQLLMTEFRSVDEEVLDAVAEVANMIVGNVKTILEQKLGNLGLSIPTVIFGRNFETRSVGNRDWVIVPFMCGDDYMNVQISIAPNRNAHGTHVTPGFPIGHNVVL